MKTLKITTGITAILLLLLNFTSCKKDKAPEALRTISTEDLLDQYIVLTLNTSPKMRILYFNKDGNEIKGTLDNVSGRRVQPVSISDNTFTFDTDGDGKKVYKFTLSRNDAGKLMLSSSTYQNPDANVSIEKTLMANVADAQDFNGKTYTQNISGDPDYYLKFITTNTWKLIDYKNANGASYDGNFYQIAPGAWKGTNNGANYMGVSIPASGTEPAQLLMEKAGAAEILYFKSN